MKSKLEKHFVASGLVINHENTKMLMIYHKKLDIWVIPGGHLEPNEYPAEGALREIFEETGIKANVIDSSCFSFEGNQKESKIPTPYVMLSEFIPEKDNKSPHLHIDFVFLCVADEINPVKQVSEVKNVKWMTFNEVLSTDTFESIKEFARMKEKGINERI